MAFRVPFRRTESELRNPADPRSLPRVGAQLDRNFAEIESRINQAAPSLETHASHTGDLTSSSYVEWPASNGRSVTVPPWASNALVIASVNCAYVTNTTNNEASIQLDGAGGARTYLFGLPSLFGAAAVGGTIYGHDSLFLQDAFDVTDHVGTAVTVRVVAKRNSGSGAARGIGASLQVFFT